MQLSSTISTTRASGGRAIASVGHTRTHARHATQRDGSTWRCNWYPEREAWPTPSTSSWPRRLELSRGERPQRCAAPRLRRGRGGCSGPGAIALVLLALSRLSPRIGRYGLRAAWGTGLLLMAMPAIFFLGAPLLAEALAAPDSPILEIVG